MQVAHRGPRYLPYDPRTLSDWEPKLEHAVVVLASHLLEHPMKFTHIAPLVERVPHRLYGGRERIVSYLTEELVAHGQDVILFAGADSRTRAALVLKMGSLLGLDRGRIHRRFEQRLTASHMARDYVRIYGS